VITAFIFLSEKSGLSPKPTPIHHVRIHHLLVYSHRTGPRSPAGLPQIKRQTHQASTARPRRETRPSAILTGSVTGSEGRTKSPARGASRVCSEIKTSMITREKQTWLWSLVKICARLPPPRNDLIPARQHRGPCAGVHMQTKPSAGPRLAATYKPLSRPMPARALCTAAWPWIDFGSRLHVAQDQQGYVRHQ
jgi:hypothetical protein